LTFGSVALEIIWVQTVVVLAQLASERGEVDLGSVRELTGLGWVDAAGRGGATW
jgi:hypothetical protein